MDALGLAILVASLSQAADRPLSCGAVGAPPPATMAEFTRLEEVWNQAYLRNDAAQLDALWAERITLMLHGRSVNRQEALAAISSQRTAYSRYATSELKLQVPEGIPIITGKLTASRALDGRAIDEVWLFRKVYQRGPFGCWQVVLYDALNARE